MALNKIIWAILNPLTIGLLCGFTAVVFECLGRRRCALALGAMSLLLVYALSTPALTLLTGRTLEEDYPYVPMDKVPSADAILCLGGGTGSNTNFCPYAILYSAADRPYYAASLWKAGKAPIVIVSGVDAENADGKFLMDLGVPQEAIAMENKAKNTEENAKFVKDVFNRVEHIRRVGGWKPKVLLVTSAWHMRRSMLMFKKYAPEVEVFPAATDHECLRGTGVMQWCYLVPNAVCIEFNLRYLHEWAGWLFYKLFRK